MVRPSNDRQRYSSNSDRREDGSRKRRRRRRSFLNLGIPFVQVDEFLNQSEDAVALGYRVLQETVEEIQKGYSQAKAFNEQQRKFECGEGPPPAVPWEQIVANVQGFQEIAFRAAQDSTEIFFDSITSGTRSARSAAKTLEQSREDVKSQPVLAGPVFETPVKLTVRAGDRPPPEIRDIRHRGLTRLRIHTVVDPLPQRLIKDEERLSAQDPRERLTPGTLRVAEVKFAPLSPTEEEVSRLTVNVGEVPRSALPGTYEGLIKARNFELLIAKLIIEVIAPTSSTSDRASKRATPRTRLRTSSRA